MKVVDLRSDTVTKPTKGMLNFMFDAKVGDDVFGEDETINALEVKTASLFKMEAGLFCPSGTMTNQIGIKILSNPPGELICDHLSHVYQYEGGGIAFNSGLSVNLLKGDRGRLNAEMVRNAINPDDVHKAGSQLVTLENTCNRGGGSIYDFKDLNSISVLCKERGLNYHLDGARIFNALCEADYTASEIGPLFDTISVCLSKGLGCPVGSVLLGSVENIKKAKRIRKILGGGMRQAGYLAAAGIYALDHHIERLKEDHIRAKQIAAEMERLSFTKSLMPVETNVVVFELNNDINLPEFLSKLKKENILAVAFGPQQVRFVTHLDVDDEQLDYLVKILKSI